MVLLQEPAVLIEANGGVRRLQVGDPAAGEDAQKQLPERGHADQLPVQLVEAVLDLGSAFT